VPQLLQEDCNPFSTYVQGYYCTKGAQVRFPASLCGICGERLAFGTCFPSASVLSLSILLHTIHQPPLLSNLVIDSVFK
jgi:hypothetical protein